MSIHHMQMVFDAGDLTSGEKSVLLAYCNFTDPHGYCWPGVERIADMTGASPRTVKRTRAALTERGLLGSKRRLTKSGQSITSMTRVNLEMLASLKRPPRVYDDNVIEEITFAVPDQGTCQDDTPATSEGATVTPPWGHHGPGEGDTVAPNPSGEPSSDPSSSSVTLEDITPVVADKPSRKKTRRSPEDIVLEKLAAMAPTLEEAAAVVELVIYKAAAKGTNVEQPDRWITNRDARVLAQDLEDVRRRSRKPGTDTCGLHDLSLESGTCSSCMGDIKAGDTDQIRAHLSEVGGDSRPDLVAVLGAPHVPAQATGTGFTWEDQLRAERRARNGVVGGSRGYVPDHTFWKTITDEDLRKML